MCEVDVCAGALDTSSCVSYFLLNTTYICVKKCFKDIPYYKCALSETGRRRSIMKE